MGAIKLGIQGLVRSKVYGRKVHIHTYVSVEMYHVLKRHVETGEERRESAVVRRAVREWLEMKGARTGPLATRTLSSNSTGKFGGNSADENDAIF